MTLAAAEPAADRAGEPGGASKGEAGLHPRAVLLATQGAKQVLPVCDHYCGVEALILKSFKLQDEMAREFGICVFDVTLDCEDGAPSGRELEHANRLAMLMNSRHDAIKMKAREEQVGLALSLPRMALRVHAIGHAAFLQDVDIIVGGCASLLSHVMLPKVETVADVDAALIAIDAAAARAGRNEPMPVHVLIESAFALHHAFEIAAHPRVQSLSFGLMDFVSSHAGAIPESAMGASGQFTHPLVVRAKLEIAAACHAHGKVASHCVVTEFRDTHCVSDAARQANDTLGYQRMWSIHPAQIRPILAAFAPSEDSIDRAAEVILAAQQAAWAPISYAGRLHDRASYRYFWQVLERAHSTGRALPGQVQSLFEVAH